MKQKWASVLPAYMNVTSCDIHRAFLHFTDALGITFCHCIKWSLHVSHMGRRGNFLLKPNILRPVLYFTVAYAIYMMIFRAVYLITNMTYMAYCCNCLTDIVNSRSGNNCGGLIIAHLVQIKNVLYLSPAIIF